MGYLTKTGDWIMKGVICWTRLLNVKNDILIK